MTKRVIRRFDAYAMHTHHDASATYADLFRRLSNLNSQDRVIELKELIIGFPIIEPVGNRFFIRAVEGGDSAGLVLNTDTGQTRENILGKSEVLSEASHLLVDPSRRRAAIEVVRKAPSAVIIGSAIEAILRRHFKDLRNLRFDFTPVIGAAFVKELSSFERIRIARLRVTKPNASWSDHYTKLSDLMEESGGEKGEIAVRASEGNSLAKNAGIVGTIKEVVEDKQPYLDDAAITGTREGEIAETTVRAKKHIVHTKERIVADDAGVASPEDVRQKLSRFLASVQDESQ